MQQPTWNRPLHLALHYALIGIVGFYLVNRAPGIAVHQKGFTLDRYDWVHFAFVGLSALFLYWALSREHRARAASEQLCATRRESLDATTQAARSMQRRLLLLDEVGRCLADADMEVPARLIKAARVLVPMFADWCLLDRVEPDGSLARLAVISADPAKESAAARLESVKPSAPQHAAYYQTLLEHPQGFLRQMLGGTGGASVPSDDPVIHCLEGAGIPCTGSIIMPIRARGRTLGLITFLSTKPERSYDVSDLSLSRDVAARMGALLDSSRLFEEAQETGRRLEARVAELHGLSEAAVAVNSSLRLSEVLQVITDQARLLIGAHLSGSALLSPQDGTIDMVAYSFTEKHAAFRTYQSAGPITGDGLHAWMLRQRANIRVTQAEMEAHPGFERFGPEAGKHPPIRGLLAVPIYGRSGDPLGLIQVSDRFEGEFTESDERLLTHLSRLAAVAVENSRLYEEVQRSQSLLTSQTDLLKVVSDSMSEGVVVLNEQGHLAYVNQATERVTGWLADELTGRCLKDLIRCSETEARCGAGPCPVLLALRDNPDQAVRKTLFVRRDGAYIPVEYSLACTTGGGLLLRFAPLSSRRGVKALRTAEAAAAKGKSGRVPPGVPN